ncbi:cytoplasmic protein [Salmonella enterica]|nr:cytoplasmic protein [Salmonella enterica subsp. enterica]ECG8211734.1 cytoplasmic protein [Salmonella enterica]ECO9908522.1 cytoplasmic protein [Salmonella enterica]EEA3032309.1 cytoplasmic protein [Salmonella enterica]
MTRTALLKAGYSRATIAAMTPVAERQNRHSGDWYPLYRVQTETRDDSGEKNMMSRKISLNGERT